MASTSDYPIIVEIVCSHKKMATDIGKALVDDRMAACVNILPGVSSFYRWNEKVESATEVILLAKTLQSSFESLKRKVLSLHTYECPCVVSWKIDEGHLDYLEWIEASVRYTPQEESCSSFGVAEREGFEPS